MFQFENKINLGQLNTIDTSILYYIQLLHRCSDQTGCCQNPGEVCRPENVIEVEKVFFVNHLVINAQKVAGQRLAPRLKAPKQNFTTMTESLNFMNHTSCKCIKLAPRSIEHDDLQSVVSRPLVDPINVSLNSKSFLYHMIGTAALIAAIMVLFVVYKCFFLNYSPVRHDQV